MTGIETIFIILLSGLHWRFASIILWNILSVVILFADKLKPSTDKFLSYYINVKFFKKSAKTCDNPKPFPEKLWQNAFTARYSAGRRFCAHKPRQIGCVGFVGNCRVHFPDILFARHRAKQGVLGFLAAHSFNHQPDIQRETSDKRVAFSEVHQLSVVVFDFLKYGVLLLRQRSE